MTTKAALRLFNGISAEIEWLYLVNENYIGEKLIVPLLQDVYNDDRLPKNLKPIIGKQIDDEIRHCAEYGEFVKNLSLRGSNFDDKFAAAFATLPSCAEKLFALQGVLEGIALGCFFHRYKYWEEHPTSKVDRNSIRDEMEHVAFSYAHFEELKRNEGVISLETFKNAKKLLNSAFKETFNAESIPGILKRDYGVSLTSGDVSSVGLEQLSSNSRRILKRNLNRFLGHYFAGV